MFHLQERQLHLILGLLLGASVILFCIMALPGKREQVNQIETLTDYSEGWICSYATSDTDLLKKNLTDEEIEAGHNQIQEIVNLPGDISSVQDEKVEITNQLPVISGDNIYLVTETKKAHITVYVGTDCLYQSRDKDASMPAFHVITIPAQYQNKDLRIVLESAETTISLGGIYYGSYLEVLSYAFTENGIYFAVGGLLLIVALCMFLLWCLIDNKWWPKRVLLYGSFEGFGMGAAFLVESRLFQVITGWNYSLHFVRACVILIVAMLHLLVVRCLMYKKKVLFLVDMGIVFYGVIYISVMVLQGFSLIRFSDIYQVGKILYAICLLVYTVVLAVAVYDYGRKEGRLVLAGNGILLLGILGEIMASVLGKSANAVYYIPVAFLLYMCVIWFYGLKSAASVERTSKEGGETEQLRAQLLEQMNPNLLFAAFHTLQKMIKNGSGNSVKMIYYISVYFRDNLRALENPGDVINFEQELEHIIAYLQLQRTRNRELNFTMECKEKDFKVPRHCIEPIVENAVKYGIAGNNNQGNVVLRSYQREDGYAIQVIDDGIGFDVKTLKRQSPTALLNLLDELKKCCKAETEIISKEGKGTVVTIILPVLENELLQEEPEQVQ
jgi:anti-sigma regulatory factor (Ser/Thr protein kinase)